MPLSQEGKIASVRNIVSPTAVNYYVKFNIRNNSFAPRLSKILNFEFSTQEANNGKYSANQRWQIVFL